MMVSRQSVKQFLLRSGMALLHHDVSEKELNLGLFPSQLRFIIVVQQTKELARECYRVYLDLADTFSQYIIAGGI